MLVLDTHGRVMRDDLYARPDGDIFGRRPDQLPVRHLHWTTYDRDANGAVMVAVEQDERGPYNAIRYERDGHGEITHCRTIWSRGQITDERYRQSYDACGNLVLTERLRDDGTVRDRVTRRYDCVGSPFDRAAISGPGSDPTRAASNAR